MMASQFSRSCDSCQRNVTGCLATCWMVQNASWSQFDPGKMTTPNFMHSSETRLEASLAWVNFCFALRNTQRQLRIKTSRSALLAQGAVVEEAVPPQDPRRVGVPCGKKSCHQKHRLHREQTLTASIDRARGPYASPGSSK